MIKSKRRKPTQTLFTTSNSGERHGPPGTATGLQRRKLATHTAADTVDLEDWQVSKANYTGY